MNQHEWLDKHKDADMLVFDDNGVPVRAEYRYHKAFNDLIDFVARELGVVAGRGIQTQKELNKYYQEHGGEA